MDASGEAARIVARTAPATVSAPAAQGHFIVRYGERRAHARRPILGSLSLSECRFGLHGGAVDLALGHCAPVAGARSQQKMVLPAALRTTIMPGRIYSPPLQPASSTIPMDSRFDGNDITPARAVTPSQAGIYPREHCRRRMSRRQGGAATRIVVVPSGCSRRRSGMHRVSVGFVASLEGRGQDALASSRIPQPETVDLANPAYTRCIGRVARPNPFRGSSPNPVGTPIPLRFGKR